MNTFTCPKCSRELIDNGKNGNVTIHLVKTCGFPKKESQEILIMSRYNLTASDLEEIRICYKNGSSLPELRTTTNLSLATLRKIIGKSKTRSVKDASAQAHEKYKITCLHRYGVENISQLETTQNKKEQTFYQNYGVSNIFKSEEFKKSLDSLMIKKYGVKRITAPMLSAWHPKTELIIKTLLESLEIPHTHSFYLCGKQFDFLLPDQKIIIEVNGDFWHANPTKYKPNDLLPFPGKAVVAKNLWKKDYLKRKLANEHGYYVVYVWESDIKILTKSSLMDKITNAQNCQNQEHQKNQF